MGALTSKSYAFSGRPWESSQFESLDVLNGSCSSVIVETRGMSIMRVLPKYSSAYLGWLPDRVRIVYDSINYGKVSTPFLRVGRSYEKSSWKFSYNIVLVVLTLLKVKSLSSSNCTLFSKYKILNIKGVMVKILRNFGSMFLKKKSLRRIMGVL